jgi:pyruvate carboxylase
VNLIIQRNPGSPQHPGRRCESDPHQQQSRHHHDRSDDGRQGLSYLPLTVESIEQILEENKIDAVLPTMGGQTALNLCKEADELGVWEKYGVKLIGVDIKAIDKAEDREKFRNWMIEMNIPVCSCAKSQLIFRRKRICTGNWFPIGIASIFYTGWKRRRHCI